MKVKVTGISGSPRKGNTEIMVEEALRGAKKAGAENEFVSLREEAENPKLYAKLEETDAFVFGSPNYFNNVSALFKEFIDRTNPLWEKRSLRGKTAGIVFAGGYNMKSLETGVFALEEFCRIHEIKVKGKVLAAAEKPGEVKENKEIMEKCFELGKNLVEV